MKHLVRLTLVCLCVCLGTGCVSYGSKVPAEKTVQIETGRTTRVEVEKLLGKPSESVSKDGRTLYRYDHTSSGLLNRGMRASDALSVSFDVLFDEQLKVIKTHRHEIQLRLNNNSSGGFSMGKLVSPEEISFVEKGKTRLAELERKFGPPTTELLNLDETVSRIWWSYYQTKAFSPELIVKFIVDFDIHDVVEDYALTEEKAR